MEQIFRITPDHAHELVQNGSALLICAYPQEEKFKNNRIKGAIARSVFEAELETYPRSKEMIFYCN